MKNEQLFWKKLIEGDKNAVKEIFKENISLLLKYGHRFTDKVGLIDECIVALFLELWKKRNALESPQSLKIFLMQNLRQKIEIRLSDAQLKRA